MNKQYSKEEYEILKAKIIEDMKIIHMSTTKENLGLMENFSVLVSVNLLIIIPTAYKFFPKTKRKHLLEGFTWNDEEEKQVDATTLVETIYREPLIGLNESILQEIISCINCKRKYKISMHLELDLLKKMNLPIPHECPRCRENKLDLLELLNRNYIIEFV